MTVRRIPFDQSTCAACRSLGALCPRHMWNHETFARSCEGCSTPFTTRYVRQRFCRQQCQQRAAESRLGHRSGRGAGRRFPRVRYAQRSRILERDAWRCRICAAPIDPELRFPHPGAASIDHVDPDGEHVDENLQAAHLACNVAKGRKLIARAA